MSKLSKIAAFIAAATRAIYRAGAKIHILGLRAVSAAAAADARAARQRRDHTSNLVRDAELYLRSLKADLSIRNKEVVQANRELGATMAAVAAETGRLRD